MRALAALTCLLLLAPFAAAHDSRSERYVGASAGPASWLAACAEGVNVGAACFDLHGHETTARVHVRDDLGGTVGSRWVALDADLLPLGTGSACFQDVEIPSGSAFLVIELLAIGLSPIPECQSPPVSGAIEVDFG